MATLTRPVQNYPAGTYGPFSLGFVPVNVEELRLTLDNTAAWPAADPLFTARLTWSTGEFVQWSIPSPPNQRNGTISPTVVLSVGVPRDDNGKIEVTGGSVIFTVHEAFATGLKLETL